MITTRSAKNPIARRACLDLRIDKYITSIVLRDCQIRRQVSFNADDAQEKGIVVTEWSEDAKQSEYP